MQICVKTLTGNVANIDVEALDTIADIKLKFQNQEGTPAEKQKLIFGGKQLEDSRALADYGIKQGAAIHVVVALSSGPPAASGATPSTPIGSHVASSAVPSSAFGPAPAASPVTAQPSPFTSANSEDVWSSATRVPRYVAGAEASHSAGDVWSKYAPATARSSPMAAPAMQPASTATAPQTKHVDRRSSLHRIMQDAIGSLRQGEKMIFILPRPSVAQDYGEGIWRVQGWRGASGVVAHEMLGSEERARNRDLFKAGASSVLLCTPGVLKEFAIPYVGHVFNLMPGEAEDPHRVRELKEATIVAGAITTAVQEGQPWPPARTPAQSIRVPVSSPYGGSPQYLTLPLSMKLRELRCRYTGASAYMPIAGCGIGGTSFQGIIMPDWPENEYTLDALGVKQDDNLFFANDNQMHFQGVYKGASRARGYW